MRDRERERKHKKVRKKLTNMPKILQERGRMEERGEKREKDG